MGQEASSGAAAPGSISSALEAQSLGYAPPARSAILQPLTIQVQMSEAAPPHWTAYVTAIGTPIVAIAAAVLAGLIAYRNWRTAQNKLKFDLFERRSAVYAKLEEVRWVVARRQVWNILDTDAKRYQDYLATRLQARWLFDERVNEWLDGFDREVKHYFLNCVPEFDKPGPMSAKTVEVSVRYREAAANRAMELGEEMRNVFAESLSIRH